MVPCNPECWESGPANWEVGRLSWGECVDLAFGSQGCKTVPAHAYKSAADQEGPCRFISLWDCLILLSRSCRLGQGDQEHRCKPWHLDEPVPSNVLHCKVTPSPTHFTLLIFLQSFIYLSYLFMCVSVGGQRGAWVAYGVRGHLLVVGFLLALMDLGSPSPIFVLGGLAISLAPDCCDFEGSLCV